MTDKALRQYIYEKYYIKVKRIKFGGPYYTLSYNYDSQGGYWTYTSLRDKYGSVLYHRLFTNLSELVDALEKEERANNGDQNN